jgi:hypothetical protein
MSNATAPRASRGGFLTIDGGGIFSTPGAQNGGALILVQDPQFQGVNASLELPANGGENGSISIGTVGGAVDGVGFWDTTTCIRSDSASNGCVRSITQIRNKMYGTGNGTGVRLRNANSFVTFQPADVPGAACTVSEVDIGGALFTFAAVAALGGYTDGQINSGLIQEQL